MASPLALITPTKTKATLTAKTAG
jgi:hypothetical protein